MIINRSARQYLRLALLTAISTTLVACVSESAVNKPSATNPAVIAPAEPTRMFNSQTTQNESPLALIKLMERSVEEKTMLPRYFAQTYVISGDERGTLEIAERGRDANPLAPLDVTGYQTEPAIAAIVAAAQNRRIVMLNEYHVSQRQRAFAFDLAAALRKAGFTHFGAEAFHPEIEENMRDGVPKLNSGTYIKDPLFGDLARQVKKIGYQLFAYDWLITKLGDPTPTDLRAQIATREQAQAENIKAVLDANPNARMFIYVGGSHASKAPINGDEWMGLRLQRMTGIDPLTIDQNLGTPSARPERDGATYRGIASLGAQTGSVVLKNAKGEWLGRTGHDMVVFHPRVPDVAGRPGWLTMGGYRKPMLIKFAASQTRTMVRAHVQGEPAYAIAMDQIIVPANQSEVTLMLPTGKYVITRENEAGETTPLPDVSVIQ